MNKVRAIRAWVATPPALLIFAAALLALAEAAGAVAVSHPPRGAQLYVSPVGTDEQECTRADPCRTIGHAVTLAPPGAEIDVARGVYPEEVVLTKRLTVKGSNGAEIDANGRNNGVLIRGRAAAGSVVRGLVVQDATYEGILALQTEAVLITDDVVRHNDRGYFARPFVGECARNGPIAGQVADLRAGGCGEAIHLASTSGSRVIANFVTDNTGGIYLTDEAGPAAHNVVSDNLVVGNLYDCGIALASHTQRALSVTGRLRPRAGGVYDNIVSDNIANHNGLLNAGAGILVAAAFPGGAAYGNRIVANTVVDNGLPGITLHSHYARQDLSANVIERNVIGRNGTHGWPHGGPGDGDARMRRTAGILVSAVTRATRHIVVAGSRISDDYFGIWTRHAPGVMLVRNHFSRVRVPVRRKLKAVGPFAASA